MNKKPITILHLITTLDVGGAQMALLKLLPAMDRKIFAQRVISLDTIGPVGEKILELGIPVHALNLKRWKINLVGLIRLWHLIVLMRPQILQTWLYHADLLGFVVGRLASVRKIVWNIRGSYHDLTRYGHLTKWVIRVCSICSRYPNAIIYNSKAGLKFHRSLGYREKECIFIPNGFDTDKFKANQKIQTALKKRLCLHAGERSSSNSHDIHVGKDISLIGLIARYDAMKDHPTFVRAASQLLEANKNLCFVLVGRGITWDNEKLAGQIPPHLKNHFQLLGERDDMEAIIPGLDILCSSSYGEGFPNVIGEAMSCEVPCVVTNVGDSALIVGSTGKVVPPGDPETLAKGIIELLGMPAEKRLELGREARKRIKKYFSLNKIVSDYEYFYRQVAES